MRDPKIVNLTPTIEKRAVDNFKTDYATRLRNMKTGMFGERDTIPEAQDYLNTIAKSSGEGCGSGVVTAAMVLLNTMLEKLAKDLEASD